MKTLVIGTGGREHALARALARDPGVTEVHAAPGNPGMTSVATLHDVDPLDGPAVAALAASLGVDLVVVGPEAPLVAGEGHDPHRATSVWSGAREFLGGRIEVTAPVDDPEGGPGSSTPTVFDPTRVVDGIELSDDPILRYRPSAYTESVSRRMKPTS